VIGGTGNHSPLHVDTTRARESDPLTISGTYLAPISLLLVLLGSLTAFWY